MSTILANQPLSTQEVEEQLEQNYREIQNTRMQGVPVINSKLSVKALGFHRWNDCHLGVLLTPWFMNIMLLPSHVDDENWQDITVGQEIFHSLPSGRYTFIVGFEDSLGFYQSCSLFSPMFEFENQAAAELTAKATIEALFDKSHEDIASQHPASDIEKIWSGEKTLPNNDEGLQAEPIEKLPVKSLEEKLQEPLSRRNFLRGRVIKRDESKNTKQS